MTTKILSAIAAIALVGFISTTPAFAQDKGATDQSQHEGHHPDAAAKTPADTKPMGDQGMMGKMDMSQMQGMMHECMEMHKDGKMCDHNMMDKCQEKMGKGECQKMMKQAKAQDKKTKKK